MKIHEYNEMMRYLRRPPNPYTKEERKQIVKDFHKKSEEALNVKQQKSKPLGIVPYIKKMNFLYGNGNEDDPDTPSQMNPKYIDPLEFQKIKEAIPVSPMVKKEKDKKWKYTSWSGETQPEGKKIKKEIKVVKKELPKDWKPQYLNGNVINMTPLIDDEWWSIFGEDPPKEDDVRVPTKADIEKILNIKRKEVAGLEAILSPGRKIT